MTVEKSRLSTVFAGLVLSAFTSAAIAQPEPTKSGLSEADRVAIFKAAGATLNKGKWLICTPPADSGAPPPAGATIETARDLNGDGRLEAVVTDSGTFCYGSAETGFQLLSQQTDGRWRVMTGNNGIPEFLKTRGVGGWPDMSVGGPGFCFPVQRWNGKSYELHHFEYQGKRCKPQR